MGVSNYLVDVFCDCFYRVTLEFARLLVNARRRRFRLRHNGFLQSARQWNRSCKTTGDGCRVVASKRGVVASTRCELFQKRKSPARAGLLARSSFARVTLQAV